MNEERRNKNEDEDKKRKNVGTSEKKGKGEKKMNQCFQLYTVHLMHFSTRLQPASRWRAALEIHEILNRNNYFINKWTHEIQVIQSSITCDDVRPIKKWGFRPKKFKKSAKKVSKKGPKKDQYYSLKQKSEGYFSVPEKKL